MKPADLRIGRIMQQVQDIVAAYPGCNKSFVARQTGQNLSDGYEIVNRAIRLGYIRYEKIGTTSYLYLTGRSRARHTLGETCISYHLTST